MVYLILLLPPTYWLCAMFSDLYVTLRHGIKVFLQELKPPGQD